MTTIMRGNVIKGLLVMLWIGVAVAAQAGNIVFTISGTLSLDSGSDTSGLDGATFTYTSTFLDTDNYTSWGVPLDQYTITTSVEGTSSVTILGSSSGNDGTYAVGDSTFAPRFTYSNTGSGFYYPLASYISATSPGAPPQALSFQLTDTTDFNFRLQMTPSASGAIVTAGDPVQSDDFLGTSPVFYAPDTETNVIQIGDGFYTLTGATAAVPEGKYISLAFGIFCLGFVGYRRYRRKA